MPEAANAGHATCALNTGVERRYSVDGAEIHVFDATGLSAGVATSAGGSDTLVFLAGLRNDAITDLWSAVGDPLDVSRRAVSQT